jgi:hypothetical protein
LILADPGGDVDPVDDNVKEAVKWGESLRTPALRGGTYDYVNG